MLLLLVRISTRKFDIQACHIPELCRFRNLSGKPIKKIGIRPGEKIDEKLICFAESLRVKDIGTHYILGPSYQKIKDSPESKNEIFEYTSKDEVLSLEELKNYLTELGHIDFDLNKYTGKSIEEINAKGSNS